MQSAELSVKSLADDLAVTHHDRTHERVRADPSAPALSKLQGAPEVRTVHGCDLGVHRTD
jgi:hypothetical protein